MNKNILRVSILISGILVAGTITSSAAAQTMVKQLWKFPILLPNLATVRIKRRAKLIATNWRTSMPV